MPEPKRPLKVFLCHAHADRDPVRGLYSRLTKDGVDAWLDKEKLLGGADWEYEIRNAVRESDVVIVCHSKQFNQKGFRQKEVKIALEEADLLPKGEIFIIPVRLEECDVLDDLKRWHWVDLFESDGYERLLRALRVRADKIGATLQVKRSWLPRITTLRTKNKKLAEIKKIDEIPESKLPPKDDATLPQGNFPAGWDTEWMPSSESEKVKSESDEKAVLGVSAESSKAQSTPKRKLDTTSFISVMAIVFCVASVTLIPILSSLSKKPEPTPTPQIKLTNTVEVISSLSSTLTVNEISLLTSTPVITATSTSLPTEITDAKGGQMVLVPAGDFVVGSDYWIYTYTDSDAMPANSVYIGSYYIDKYEVINMLYKNCVNAGVCKVPVNLTHYNRLEYENHPVVYVTWQMARTYCEDWRKGRLPSEAEWEKAARAHGLDSTNSCDEANFQGGPGSPLSPGLCVGNTTSVGSYDAKSIHGLYDMLGNVWEWTSSLYKPYPYDPIDGREDLNSSDYRVLRGGAWNYANKYGSLEVIDRLGKNPNIAEWSYGFRCAIDVNP